jgi:DNA-binding response OmpR family regulator
MKTLLIVDDQATVCTFLSRFFESRGFRILTAQSGREALDALRVETPDYLLLDIRMPDISGLDILQLAKSRYPHLKVVMVTGISDEETMRAAFRLGASDYITKPFGADDQGWARAFFAAD